jgi:glycosyltransferase involved in cell wall biosynthesis
MKKCSLSIVIPTKNEEECIDKIIKKIEKISFKNFEILIVDKSTDKTKEKVKKYMKKYNNLRLVNQLNNGKGNAMKLGVKEAKGNVICFLDGDGTYPPTYISKMFKVLKYCDVVVASRFIKKNKCSLGNFFGYKILPFLFKKYMKKFKTSEPLTGMRMMRKDTWNKLNLNSEGFMIEIEMEVEMAKRGMKVAEIPIPYILRIGGKSKFIWNWKTIWEMKKYINDNEKYLSNLNIKQYL